MQDELNVIILDVATGEVINRPFTEEEVTQFEAFQAEAAEAKQAIDSTRNSALAKLAALGLTEEEIAAL
jgi:DNA-binding NarL/FixJ family response regulator